MKTFRELVVPLFVVTAWLAMLSSSRADDAKQAKAEPDKVSTWEGFERRDFKIDGRNCLLVVPKTPAKEKPWIWRTEFFGHQPQADIALLHKGFHVAYMDVQNMYGAPIALDHMDKFYDHLTTVRGLAPKTVLEGFSRGGLFALNWAARHPHKVACAYNDAPVCDFKSWPGGKGKSKGSPGDWQQCLKVYGLTEQQALDYKLNPVDNLEAMAKAKVPLLHVCGEADDVVPIEENTRLLEKRYQKLGGPITVIAKPGVGHHPHSLEHPAPIVNFVLKHTIGAEQHGSEGKKANVELRGSLNDSRIHFEKKKVGHVAFMGGSITEMNGYRPLVCDLLKRRFPETKFTFTNAGIASTCSTTGAFRLGRDVLDKGPVDLFFVEFAVNDDQDAGLARRECIRGMEGIIRHVRAHNPNADIVITYFVNPAMLKTIQDGKVPLVIASHEEVAKHYDISAVNLAAELADRIRAGTFTWEQFGGVHPARPGNELCASLIDELLARAWKEPLPAEAVAEKHRLPEAALDANNYEAGRFIDPKKATHADGWKVETPDWKSIPGQWREPFRHIPLLSATKPGAELKLAFEGRAIGAYLLAGPDAGFVEYTIDDGSAQKADLFHGFSRGLHYPRTVMFAADLKPGPHTLKLRIANERNKASTGNAARIMQFVAN
jgi:pimeloyl-ACP methyl ester carboxylesterase/lysophospholipase L1-like esterase